MHPPDLGQHAHFDHSSIPPPNEQQGIQSKVGQISMRFTPPSGSILVGRQQMNRFMATDHAASNADIIPWRPFLHSLGQKLPDTSSPNQPLDGPLRSDTYRMIYFSRSANSADDYNSAERLLSRRLPPLYRRKHVVRLFASNWDHSLKTRSNRVRPVSEDTDTLPL
jgi:hypothetical protein